MCSPEYPQYVQYVPVMLDCIQAYPACGRHAPNTHLVVSFESLYRLSRIVVPQMTKYRGRAPNIESSSVIYTRHLNLGLELIWI